MPKLIYLYLFILITLLPACSIRRAGIPAKGIPALATDSSSLKHASRIHSFVQSLSPHTFNGALLVSQEDKLLLAEGYGYARWKERQPFELQTISHTAALAQQFTAAAILKLQAQNRLQLNDSLGQFFRKVPADKEGIRLKQLLTHTSGLPDDIAGPKQPLQKEAFLSKVWEEPLLAVPGEEYLYSGLGYRLLAAVVEAASGMTYEAYLRKALLEPARLPHTGYVLPEYAETKRAKEQTGSFGQELALPDYSEMAPALWHILGSSGMLSSAQDIYRWQHLLLKGNLLPDKERSLLWEAREGVPPGQSAYGWRLTYSADSTPLMMHNSRVGNFVSQLLYYPRENLSISLLANRANYQVEHLGPQIGRMLLLPQYSPAPMPYDEQKLLRIPQGEEAEPLRALTGFLQEEDQLKARQLVEAYYSPAFRQAATMEMHLQALEKLRERLANASLERIHQAWPVYTLALYAPGDNIWYRLQVQVEPYAPYGITSIALETADPF